MNRRRIDESPLLEKQKAGKNGNRVNIRLTRCPICWNEIDENESVAAHLAADDHTWEALMAGRGGNEASSTGDPSPSRRRETPAAP